MDYVLAVFQPHLYVSLVESANTKSKCKNIERKTSGKSNPIL